MYPEQLLTPHLSQEALSPSLCAMEARSQYKRGLWTADEDQILMDYIRMYGNGRWNRVAKITGLKRCGKSCRLRWINYLSPNVKKGNFTQEEEDLIIRLHRLLGNRWSLIAGRVPGRTDNQVKNHWNTHLSKKLGMKRRQRKYRPSTPTTSRNHQIKAEGNMVCQDSDANRFEAHDSGDGALGLGDYSHNIVESVNNTELISGEYAVDSGWFADSDVSVTHSSLMELREMLPLEMLWKNL